MTTALAALAGPPSAAQAESARIALDAFAPDTRRACRVALATVADWHGAEVSTDATMARYLAARPEAGARTPA